ncbi:MAG: flagellar basal body rod protein FlgB [Dethiobacter sp.]|nr:flagellar basal body rod protein FlgB [Dethiobacter sp.]MBS3902172.1 flagellar basal body rod protein FlgB [Dethiobacter sp.]MBS3989681.1 flagellar basal body rod protein FlgB [Dethiobacter sp.]
MINGLSTDKVSLVLQKGLDAAGERQRVMAHNIANLNTPLYKRKEVHFEEELRQALLAPSRLPLAATHPRHMGRGPSLQDVGHDVKTDLQSSMRPDGNNVDIEREMAMLAANQLNYNALVQVLSGRQALLRYVIHEGRR